MKLYIYMYDNIFCVESQENFFFLWCVNIGQRFRKLGIEEGRDYKPRLQGLHGKRLNSFLLMCYDINDGERRYQCRLQCLLSDVRIVADNFRGCRALSQ